MFQQPNNPRLPVRPHSKLINTSAESQSIIHDADAIGTSATEDNDSEPLQNDDISSGQNSLSSQVVETSSIVNNCTALVPVGTFSFPFSKIPSLFPVLKSSSASGFNREFRKRKFTPDENSAPFTTPQGFDDEAKFKRIRETHTDLSMAGTYFCFKGANRLDAAGRSRSEDFVKFEVGVLERVSIAMKATRELGWPLPIHILDDLLNLSDDTFHGIMKDYGVDMGPDNVNALVTRAEGMFKEEKLNTCNFRKFESIIQFGILPTLLSPDLFSKIAVSYDKLMDINRHMVIRNLHVLLVIKNGYWMKQLYYKTGPDEIFAALIDHLDSKNMTLTYHMIPPMKVILDGLTKYPSEPTNTQVIHIFENTFCESFDDFFAGLLYGYLQKFIHSMSEEDLRPLVEMNFRNTTIYKHPIDKLIQERFRVQTNHLSPPFSPESSVPLPYTFTSTVSIQPLPALEEAFDHPSKFQQEDDNEVEMDCGD